MTFILRLAFFILVTLLSLSALAQPSGGDQVQAFEGLRQEADNLSSAVDTASEADDADEKLVALAGRADALEQDLIALGVELSPRLSQIKTRLDQLGPAPGDGEPEEPEIVANEREALAKERAQLNQMLGLLEEESIRTKALTDRISDVRRTLFTSALSRRSNIGDAFSPELFSDIANRQQQLQSRLSSWMNFTWRFKQDGVLGAAAGLLALMLMSIWGARRTFAPWIYRDPQAVEPSYFQRLTIAFWYTVLPTLALWIFFVVAYALLDYLEILRPDIAEILSTLLVLIGIIFLVWRLSEGVFAPRLPNWRLLNISDYAARALKFFVLLMVIVATGDVLITQINAIVGTSVPITIAKSLVTSIAVGALLLLIAFVRPFLAATGLVDGERRPWPALVKLLLCVAGAGLILAALAGYIGFARFAAQQFVVTAALLSTMFLGYRTAHAISAERALLDTSIGNSLLNKHGFSEASVDRIGLATGIVMIFLVLMVGLVLLALFWGFQWSEIQRFVVGFFTNIQIGSISISLSSILIGILLFIAGLFLTRRFQRWLDDGVLLRSGVDSGARNSISTAIGYVGVGIAGLLGVSAAGLELSQLALVAGALSLGIGFGLQNIVSNFVSGLILLAERPFKSGDIIEAGTFTGIVKTVKVRATEIETFDKKTLVLPNSELINSAVVNWVHKTTLGRVEVPVGVSYDSDPQQVYELLLEIANDHPRILGNPEPFVEFANFGDSSLDFVLRGFIADIGFGIAVRTELRIAIYQRFKAAGIEIPFPQRDVNLKIDDGKVTEVLKPIAPDSFGVIKTSNKRSMEDDE